MRFTPEITYEKVKKVKGRGEIYKKIDTIIIDEVSMVRADLLDCADKFMCMNGGKDSNKPFGGIQMVFIGDLYQLPPVVTSREKELFSNKYTTPYFFSAHVFEKFQMEFVELEKIYRQKEELFIGLLNEIRNNSVSEKSLKLLNQRVDAKLENKVGINPIYLTPFNDKAFEINAEHLAKLKTNINVYLAKSEGEFNKNSYPADEEFQVAAGAQVIFLNNDSTGYWVNGTIGKVTGFIKSDEDTPEKIIVKLQDGLEVEVLPHEWDLFHYKYNSEKMRIDTEVVGKFIQYPLKLAWAITIHKSQGKTFQKVIIDMGKGAFACGQTYVALSRCTSFEGLSLVRPIKPSDIRADWKIMQFLTKYQYKISEKEKPFEDKVKLIEDVIKKNGYLEIVYLKARDEKSKRVIKPIRVGEEEYKDIPFPGLYAFCTKRNEERMFRVDRILEMKKIEFK
ncbi:MAG: hypothetical protein ACD_79C01096G0004 [uncultured bacterium]|nr:MAG: hypothetical protein ACD_79C01096G0004 [uncultured bacterium]